MEARIEQIRNNLNIVQQKIDLAVRSARRDPGAVRLVVVSKGQPVEVIRDAYQAGVRDFGENYPQEAEQKITRLADLGDVCWHMIGHLQSRRASVIASYFQIMHSVDSLNLALKLNRALAERKKKLNVLLEVNVGGEESKFGWQGSNRADWERVLGDFRQIASLSNLKVIGLMTMPPYADDSEASRPFFVKLRQLSEFLRTEIPEISWTELSMGTSSDFETAIGEGATFIRVGRAILGERPTHKIDPTGESQ